MMSNLGNSGALGEALVEFTTKGAFPEEGISDLKLSSDQLPPAIQALAQAKTNLEAEIHTINTETAPDVATWRANAASLQDDIQRSRHLANAILRQADEPVISGEAIIDAADKLSFLQAELTYNTRVREALAAIKEVSSVLYQADQACAERRILDSLRLLEKAWEKLDALPVGKGVRVARVLDARAFELKNTVHEVFEHVWKALVHVNVESKTVLITETMEGEAMSLTDAVVGLKSYKEVDQRMAHLWHELDQAIIGPRLDFDNPALPEIVVDGDTLRANGKADKSIDALFADMDKIFSYFAGKLPPDLIDSISALMMPEIVSRIISMWLDSAVPASLKQMDLFESIMATAKRFCLRLTELKFTGFNELQDWVEDAPKVWLAKCRETALDTVRIRLAEGLGSSKQVERVEKQMVSRAEGQELAAAPATAAAAEDDDWAAWDDEGDQQEEVVQDTAPTEVEQASKPAEGFDDEVADAWGWNEDGDASDAPIESDVPETHTGSNEETQDDDAADAWGWGDDDAQEEPQNQPPAKQSAAAAVNPPAQQREMILKETYNISSMPEPVLQLIFAILEDGATLTNEAHESSPVAKAASGLFSLPTLALAMFRAAGPYYYALDHGGNMFLYNDTLYLAEKLGDFANFWKERKDLSPRAQKMLRLENDVKTMQSFAARAYSNEMNIQKTVLRDLIGGEQSLIQQDDIDGCIDAAVARVRTLSTTWERILARSAWYQAVGSLVDAISLKIISDVMDAPSVSQDDAYNIAKLIATVTELDDLFLPSRASKHVPANKEAEVPQTTQYAPSWMRLKYLSEVLQSNLRDVRFLWMESELSLFFTVSEVLDLINLSFEDNARTREVIREITANPHPRQLDEGGW
ncbi:ribosome biogenesis protein ytm1 [Gnomoniopsis smithogilvyi]|uniref:Ribosome biogenesis protein ytm1 n=1 Tax=Gnomoniopsis smithogilvyi TaxID=1191159 RepID=A0A9W8YQM4_9PEZI|nr:ribosome biogenesis protein ytm1 [Gnomoniopsis smithogilvyi]